MTTRRQRLAMLGAGALLLALGAAATLSFAWPGERGRGGRGVAVYDLASLAPSMPIHDERESAWIVALPDGSYRAFSDKRPQPQRHFSLVWRTRDEVLRFWKPPPSEPGAFQGSCRTFRLFDVQGRPSCVVDPSLRITGRLPHLKEFEVSIDEARGLLIVDFDATSQRTSVCRAPDTEQRPAAPAAVPSSPR